VNRLAPMMSSVKSDWETPDEVLDLVREVFGGEIDLDPCSVKGNPTGAGEHFYPPLDGLAMSWHGRVFLNPPYGRALPAWVKKASTERADTIGLVPARPDTRWFQDWCAPPTGADAVCFWRGRLTFKGAPHPAPFPSALVLWCDRPRVMLRGRFASVFGKKGAIWL
jgi:hypothetical protein